MRAADGGGPARREQHTVQISRGDFTQALGKFNGPLAGVTARAKAEFIKLMFDGSNDAGMPEADLMHVVAMEVEITPAFDVFNPRALSLRQRVEARCRKALMQEVTRVGFEQRLRPRPDVFGSPDVATRREVHIAFRGEMIEVVAVRSGHNFTPISSMVSPMAFTTQRMSASKRRPMLPMRNVAAWLILPG